MIDVKAKGADVLKHSFPSPEFLFPLGNVRGNSCKKPFSFGFPASSVAFTGEAGSHFPRYCGLSSEYLTWVHPLRLKVDSGSSGMAGCAW